MLTEKDIRIDGNRKQFDRKQYGIYHPAEGHWSYIQHVENNAPSMNDLPPRHPYDAYAAPRGFPIFGNMLVCLCFFLPESIQKS